MYQEKETTLNIAIVAYARTVVFMAFIWMGSLL